MSEKSMPKKWHSERVGAFKTEVLNWTNKDGGMDKPKLVQERGTKVGEEWHNVKFSVYTTEEALSLIAACHKFIEADKVYRESLPASTENVPEAAVPSAAPAGV